MSRTAGGTSALLHWTSILSGHHHSMPEWSSVARLGWRFEMNALPQGCGVHWLAWDIEAWDISSDLLDRFVDLVPGLDLLVI